MEITKQRLTPRVDRLLDDYKRNHQDETPLYIILSPKECEILVEEIRYAKSLPDSYIITTYRGSRIVQNLSISDGELYVSNELPETGS